MKNRQFIVLLIVMVIGFGLLSFVLFRIDHGMNDLIDATNNTNFLIAQQNK